MLKKILAILAMLYAAASFAAVDVNKATAAELDAVKGIGPTTSKTIVDERKKHGDFKNWEDFIARTTVVEKLATLVDAWRLPGVHGAGVASLDPPTGKADLAAMVAQPRAAKRQQDIGALPGLDQPDQDRGLARTSGLQQALQLVCVPRRIHRRSRQRMQRGLQRRIQRGPGHGLSRTAARAGNSSSIIRRRSSSGIPPHPAISARLRWQPSHRPSAAISQMPMQGLRTGIEARVMAVEGR